MQGSARTWIAVTIAAAVIQPVCKAEDAVADAVRSHEATIQSYFSLEFDASIVDEMAGEGKLTYAASVLKKGRTIRLAVKDDRGNIYNRLIGEKSWQYAESSDTSEGHFVNGGIAVPRGGDYCPGDPFLALLFRLGVPGTTDVCTLDELVRRATKADAETDRAGDVKLTLRFPNRERQKDWALECVLSREHNWLVRSVTTTGRVMVKGKAVPAVYDQTVDRFAEAAPGSFFPAEVSRRATIDGKLSSTRRTTLERVALNGPIADGRLRIELPRGVKCIDEVAGCAFTLDAQGRRTNQALRSGKPGTPLTMADLEQEAGSQQPPDAATKSPWVRNRLWIFGSLAVLFIGLLSLTVSRLRRRPM